MCVVLGGGGKAGVGVYVAPSPALPKSTELSGAPAPPWLPSAENSFNLGYSPLYVLDLMPLKIFFSYISLNFFNFFFFSQGTELESSSLGFSLGLTT